MASKRGSRGTGLAQMDEKFAIPFWTEQRTVRNAEHRAAEFLGGTACAGDHDGMLSRVTDHPPLPNLPATNFKLRLDQGYQLGAGREQRQSRRQHLVEGDEGGINDAQIGVCAESSRFQVPDVGAFQADHPRIDAEFPGQLAVTDIDGKNLCRAMLQQAVGETAGRGADIKGCPADHLDGKDLQGMSQLDTAARHVGEILPAQADHRASFDSGPRFIDRMFADHNLPRQNQGAGALTGAG